MDGVKAQLEASLARLQTDYVDIYYIHRLPKDHVVTVCGPAMLCVWVWVWVGLGGWVCVCVSVSVCACVRACV